MTLKTETVRKRLLTTKEAAQYLGVSTWTIRRLVQEGKLPVVSGCEECNWRFDVRDLDHWIEQNKELKGVTR